MLSGARDTKATLFALTDFMKINEFDFHTNEIISVAISPDNKQVVTSGLDNNVILSGLLSGLKFKQIFGHEDVIMAVEFSDCGQYLLTGGRDRKARLYKFINYGSSSNMQIIEINT